MKMAAANQTALRILMALAGITTLTELSVRSRVELSRLSRGVRGLIRLRPEERTAIAVALNVSVEQVFAADVTSDVRTEPGYAAVSA